MAFIKKETLGDVTEPDQQPWTMVVLQNQAGQDWPPAAVKSETKLEEDTSRPSDKEMFAREVGTTEKGCGNDGMASPNGDVPLSAQFSEDSFNNDRDIGNKTLKSVGLDDSSPMQGTCSNTDSPRTEKHSDEETIAENELQTEHETVLKYKVKFTLFWKADVVEYLIKITRSDDKLDHCNISYVPVRKVCSRVEKQKEEEKSGSAASCHDETVGAVSSSPVEDVESKELSIYDWDVHLQTSQSPSSLSADKGEELEDSSKLNPHVHVHVRSVEDVEGFNIPAEPLFPSPSRSPKTSSSLIATRSDGQNSKGIGDTLFFPSFQ